LYWHHVPGCQNLQMFMGSVFCVHMQLVTIRTSCLVHLFSRVAIFRLMLCWECIHRMGQGPPLPIGVTIYQHYDNIKLGTIIRFTGIEQRNLLPALPCSLVVNYKCLPLAHS
jgi:hypothetical protein